VNDLRDKNPWSKVGENLDRVIGVNASEVMYLRNESKFRIRKIYTTLVI
jgi:hypothetical protein